MSKQTARNLFLTGLIATTILSFTACSSSETAASSDATAAVETVDSQFPEAQPGLIHHDISKSLTVAESLRPEQNQIITPAGTLSVGTVEVLDTVEAADIGMDIPVESTGDEPQTTVQPTPGEVFRIVTFRFEPHTMEDKSPEELPAASLSLNNTGQQTHLYDFDSSEDFRILFSVPQDGDAQLVIASEGHEQHIDVLTGERVVTEDDPAAGYYRDTTHQDINHRFPIDDDVIQVLSGFDSPGEEDDATISYDLQLRSASLSGWTPDHGWASPGDAWLSIDWGYDFTNDYLRSSVPPRLVETDLTLTADLNDMTLEDRVVEEDGSRDDVLSVLSVPVDTTDVTLSIAGTTEFILEDMVYAIVPGQDTTLPIATETLAVEFSNNSTNSDD